MTKSKESLMKLNSLSEKESELVQELFAVWKDKEFVLGVICTLKGDGEVQTMLDYIKAGNWSLPSDITTEALFIANNRN